MATNAFHDEDNDLIHNSNDSGSSNADEDGEGSFLGSAATLAIIGGATAYVGYKVFVAKRPTNMDGDATDSAASNSAANANSAIHNQLARINCLRTQKIHLHQFQYAWAAQAHLRMANVPFEEHNIRCLIYEIDML